MSSLRWSLRGLSRRLHLWLGLSLGLLLVVISLSGAALVFYVEIDRLLHPEIRVDSAEPDWDRAVATLRTTFPDLPGTWRLEVTDDGGAIPARYYSPPETQGQYFAPLLVWLSPDGGAVLRRDYWGDTLMTWLYNLHFHLLLGKTGVVVVGYAGLASLVLIMSGLLTWWPRRGQWRKSLRMKANAAPLRSLYDWHKLTGLVALVPLLVLGATGVMLALPKETDAVLSPILGAPVWPPFARAQAAGAAPVAMIPPSAAVEAGQQAIPGARIAWIATPPTAGGVYQLRVQVPGDPSRRFPHSYIDVDAQSAEVTNVFDVRDKGPSNTLKNWLHPLHDGSVGGLALRVAWVVFGFAPLVLFYLGAVRWRLRLARIGRSQT